MSGHRRGHLELGLGRMRPWRCCEPPEMGSASRAPATALGSPPQHPLRQPESAGLTLCRVSITASHGLVLTDTSETVVLLTRRPHQKPNAGPVAVPSGIAPNPFRPARFLRGTSAYSIPPRQLPSVSTPNLWLFCSSFAGPLWVPPTNFLWTAQPPSSPSLPSTFGIQAREALGKACKGNCGKSRRTWRPRALGVCRPARPCT